MMYESERTTAFVFEDEKSTVMYSVPHKIPPFHNAFRGAIVAKEISHRAAFVANSGCAISYIASAVAGECSVCIKVLWKCGCSSLWI